MRAFVGHGIGTEMHEEPQVTNYRTGAKGRRIEPGLCLAIEPMFTLGTYDVKSATTAGPWPPRTARSPLTGSIRSPLLADGPRILTSNVERAAASAQPSAA